MTPPVLVIVHGLPATGKTTIARQLAREFALPCASKDLFKEVLFDTLGWSDRAWSQRIGRASIALMFQFAEVHLAVERSCIIECNFTSELATPELLDLQARYPFQCIQLLCRCDGATLLDRFKRRSEGNERHPGHVDRLCVAELAPALLCGTTEPIHLGGTLIEVDTTDFDRVDYAPISATIRKAL